jgi:hypothetical protein
LTKDQIAKALREGHGIMRGEAAHPSPRNDILRFGNMPQQRGNNMQRLDRAYISIGLVWVVIGMIYGAWLGASHHNMFANSHAHMNLLGFVTSVLFGILHWAYPAMRASRAAVWQFVLYEIGVVVLIIGKVLVDRDGTETLFLQIGSTAVIIATAMMLWLFVARSDKA